MFENALDTQGRQKMGFLTLLHPPESGPQHTSCNFSEVFYIFYSIAGGIAERAISKLKKHNLKLS